MWSWQVSTEVGDGGECWDPDETVRIRVQREDGAGLVGFHSWSEVSCMTQTGGTVDVHLVDVDGYRQLLPVRPVEDTDAVRPGTRLQDPRRDGRWAPLGSNSRPRQKLVERVH